jgi:predicted transcriptional regulator
MTDEIKMSVRLVPELHERLKRAAERDHRSMHAQMISYIERGTTEDERRERKER